MVYNDCETGPDCAIKCNYLKIHAHSHTNKLGSVHMDHTNEVTRAEERELENVVGGGIDVGGGIGR